MSRDCTCSLSGSRATARRSVGSSCLDRPYPSARSAACSTADWNSWSTVSKTTLEVAPRPKPLGAGPIPHRQAAQKDVQTVALGTVRDVLAGQTEQPAELEQVE